MVNKSILGAMKNPTSLLLMLLVFHTPLFSQNFLSIHINDASTNTDRIDTYIDFQYNDIETIQSEIRIGGAMLLADVDYYLVIDDSTTFNYANNSNPSNANLKKYKATAGEAFVVISGTDKIDGKYIIDDYWGQLNILSQQNWGRISIEGRIEVPFEGSIHTLTMRSPSLKINSNIINEPLSSLDINAFYPFTDYESGSIETENNSVSIYRKLKPSSNFQLSSFGSNNAAIDSFIVDADYLDNDGDGFAAWRDEDDSNSSINQTSPYTMALALSQITSLEAQNDILIAERDARLTLDEVKDARVGSKMIEVSEGQANITMTLEETSDITDWSNASTSQKSIQVDAPLGTRFYRFKMAE